MFEVKFDKAFQKRIDKFVREYPKEADRAVANTADFAAERITRATPRGTGAARRSWQTKKINAGATSVTATYQVVSAIPPGKQYVPYLEFGTGLFGPKKRRITSKRPGGWLAFQILRGNTPQVLFPKRKGKMTKGYLKGEDKSTVIFAKSVKGIKPVGMVKKNIPIITQRMIREFKVAMGRKWGRR